MYYIKLPLFCVRKFIKTELGNFLNDIECIFASLVLFSIKFRRLAKTRECGKGQLTGTDGQVDKRGHAKNI